MVALQFRREEGPPVLALRTSARLDHSLRDVPGLTPCICTMMVLTSDAGSFAAAGQLAESVGAQTRSADDIGRRATQLRWQRRSTGNQLQRKHRETTHLTDNFKFAQIWFAAAGITDRKRCRFAIDVS